MRLFSVILGWLVIFAISLVSPHASAADREEPGTGRAVADLRRGDADFQFQGEFEGTAQLPGNRPSRVNIGLQIRTLGSSDYAATQYNGGLPGHGWDRSAPTNLIGKRNGDLLVLSGGELAILAHRKDCLYGQ